MAARSVSGAAEPFGQQPGAGAGDGAVDNRQQAALAVARQGSGQLQVASGRRVYFHRPAGALADRAGQARRAAPLGQVDIVEQCAGRSRLRAGEGPERIERSDGEMRREAGSSAFTLSKRLAG